MKNRPLTEHLSELKTVFNSYIEARLNLGKAIFLEKISKIGTYFLTVVTSIIIFSILLLLLVFAFSFWYGEVHGSIFTGFLISAGLYFLLGILVILFRKSIFSNNIIRNLGNVLFEEEDLQ